MDDLIAEFLAETNDGLSELDNDLVQLEMEPENEELISKIFRILHTIKGTCGFLGLTRLEKVAHKGEDVLGLFRDKKLAVTPVYVSLIFECFDAIKAIVTSLETTGQEPEGNDSELIARLEAVYNGGTPVAKASAATTQEETKEVAPQPKPEAPSEPLAQTSTQGTSPITDRVAEALRIMVTGLTLSHNQLEQAIQKNASTGVYAPMQELNDIASDLQVSKQLYMMKGLLQVANELAVSAHLPRLKANGHQIERVDNSRVLRLRGALLPRCKTICNATGNPT